MTTCPDCASSDLDVMSSDDEDYDEHGGSTITYYQCQDCGCEFTVFESTSVVTTVEKHGEDFDEDEDEDDDKKI